MKTLDDTVSYIVFHCGDTASYRKLLDAGPVLGGYRLQDLAENYYRNLSDRSLVSLDIGGNALIQIQ